MPQHLITGLCFKEYYFKYTFSKGIAKLLLKKWGLLLFG